MFHRISSSNFVKNTPLRVVFLTLISVFGYSDETLSLVFDILRCAVEKEYNNIPGGGGYLTKFCTGRLRPEVQPLTLSYTILAEKIPLLYTFY